MKFIRNIMIILTLTLIFIFALFSGKSSCLILYFIAVSGIFLGVIL